ncbi:MAG: 30S ribosomal protein S17 [Deltaproteobacteria bacterium]|nr:30S ribosomal protein S17 [Deltaproteobacteria bacterium]
MSAGDVERSVPRNNKRENRMQAFGTGKTVVGTVISNRMQKTVVVEVKRRVLHARYKKYVSKRARFKAHDEKNECGIGDRVQIAETRPQSATKRWKVTKVLEKAEGAIEIATPENIQ